MTTAEKTKEKKKMNYKVQYLLLYPSHGPGNISLVCHIDCDSCSGGIGREVKTCLLLKQSLAHVSQNHILSISHFQFVQCFYQYLNTIFHEHFE